MDVALPLAGMLTGVGLNEHVISGLLGWHPKVTLPTKPFTDAIVTLKLADPPAFTVALVVVRDPSKSQTCKVEDALCVSEPGAAGDGDGVVSRRIVLR